jgi:uroporphyrinogen-III synthase
MKYILITRPDEDAQSTALQMRTLGFEALIAPALIIHDTDHVLVDTPCDALLFSSAQGVRAVMRRHPPAAILSRMVFAVGDHTAQAARDAGFTTVHNARGAMADLAALVQKTLPGPGTLVHYCGVDTREDPATYLPGWRIDGISLYRAAPVDHLPATALAALRAGQVRAVLFYSARSAESFCKALLKDVPQADCSGTKALCLASPVVDSLGQYPITWADILVSKTPDQNGMFALLETLKS